MVDITSWEVGSEEVTENTDVEPEEELEESGETV